MVLEAAGYCTEPSNALVELRHNVLQGCPNKMSTNVRHRVRSNISRMLG